MAVVDALADGADPLRQTVKDVTVLSLAVRMGHIDIVAAMLHTGIPVDHQLGPGHRTALSYAVEADIEHLTTKRTALLLGYGADPDVRFSYVGIPCATVDLVINRRQIDAYPPEQVTIDDLRQMLDARRRQIAQSCTITQRRQALLKQARDKRFKL